MKLNREKTFLRLAKMYVKQVNLGFDIVFNNTDFDDLTKDDYLIERMFDATIPVTFFENYLIATDNHELIGGYLHCLYISDQFNKLIAYIEHRNIKEKHLDAYFNAQTQKAINEEDKQKVHYWKAEIEMKKNTEKDTENIKFFDLIIDNCNEYLESNK